MTTDELIAKLYCEEQMSLRAVAKVVGCSYETVRETLMRAGIRRRPKRAIEPARTHVKYRRGQRRASLIALSKGYIENSGDDPCKFKT